jgi:hypothetical protein
MNSPLQKESRRSGLPCYGPGNCREASPATGRLAGCTRPPGQPASGVTGKRRAARSTPSQSSIPRSGRGRPTVRRSSRNVPRCVGANSFAWHRAFRQRRGYDPLDAVVFVATTVWLADDANEFAPTGVTGSFFVAVQPGRICARAVGYIGPAHVGQPLGNSIGR